MDNTLYNTVSSKDAIYTNIPYNILTSRYKDIEFKINVDLLPELKHPKFILVGGNLAVKYTNYLEKELFNNISLLRRFVSIAKLGVEKGTIALVCNCKIGKQGNRVAHSEVIKYFLFKYHETLIKLSPYLFKSESDIEKTDDEIEEDLKVLSDSLKIQLLNNLNTNKMLSSGSIKNLEKLSANDKEQIKDLLLQQITDEAIKSNIKNSSFDDLIGANKENEVTYEESDVIENTVETIDQDNSLNKESQESSIKENNSNLFGSLPPHEIKDRGNVSSITHTDESPFYEGSSSK